MPYRTLKLDFDAGRAILTLNRPERRNAISSEMVDELPRALDEASRGARAVILTGAGSAFCSGMDLEGLRQFAAQTHSQLLHDARRIAMMFRSAYAFPRPLIAAVNGAAIAGGCGLAMLADYTLAAPEAKFGFTEVRIGFIPAIVSSFLVRQVGEKRARDLLLSGRLFGAAEAERMGFASEVVAADRLMARALELAAELAALSPSALAHTKRLLVEISEAGLDRELELAVEASAAVRETADFREGLSAFLEKRKAVWRGE